jgi:hypothetical protein
MADGYQTMINALNNYAAQTGWDERNRLAPIDWKASFAKLFHKQSQPQTKAVVPEMENPNINFNPDVSYQSPDPFQFKTDTLPAPAVHSEAPPAYSPDNPYAKMMPQGKTFFAYKETPELMGLKNQWEQDKKSKDLAMQFQQMQMESANNQYITVDENMLSQIPEQYRGLFPVGQRVKRDEWLRMNPVSKPANPLDDKLKESQIFKNYQTGNGSDDSNINLSRQYGGVMDSYQKYVSAAKARNDDPLKLTDWLRQPNQSGSLAIYNQFTGNALKSLQYPYGKKPSTKIAAKPNKNRGKIVKTGTDKKSGKKVIQYEDGTIEYQS